MKYVHFWGRKNSTCPAKNQGVFALWWILLHIWARTPSGVTARLSPGQPCLTAGQGSCFTLGKCEPNAARLGRFRRTQAATLQILPTLKEYFVLEIMFLWTVLGSFPFLFVDALGRSCWTPWVFYHCLAVVLRGQGAVVLRGQGTVVLGLV